MTIVTEVFTYSSQTFLHRKVLTYDMQSFNISLYKSDENIACSSHTNAVCKSRATVDIQEVNENYDIDRRVSDQIQDTLNTGADVVLKYDRIINIVASIHWHTNNSLTIQSKHTINIGEKTIISNLGFGILKLMAGIESNDGEATLVFGSGAQIISQEGAVKLFYNPISVLQDHKYYNPQFVCDFVIPNDSCISYMLVNNERDLDSINLFPSMDYALSTNIIPEDRYTMSPIGSKSLPFTGNFDGNGFIISNILIRGKENVGLFGVAIISGRSTIENVELKSIVVEGERFVGGLVGFTENYKFSQITISDKISVKGDSTVGGLFGAAVHINTTDDISYQNIELKCFSKCGQFAGLNVIEHDQGNQFHDHTGQVFYDNANDLF